MICDAKISIFVECTFADESVRNRLGLSPQSIRCRQSALQHGSIGEDQYISTDE
jgi:hypothetical protein